MVIYKPGFPGGLTLKSATDLKVTHPGGAVASNLKFLWDLDGDGDFSEPVENITSYVQNAQVTYGRDNANQLLGQASPGKFKAVLDNTDGRFGFFNTSSPLNQAPFRVTSGGLIRIMDSSATVTDPVLIAADDMTSPGDLKVDQLGNAWLDSAGCSKADGAVTSGISNSTPYIDLSGVTQYFVQAKLSRRAAHLNTGLIYGYNPSNRSFGAVVISQLTNYWAAISHRLITLSTGSVTILSTLGYMADVDGRYLGIYRSGSSMSIYLDGAEEITGVTPATTTGDGVGMYLGEDDGIRSMSAFAIWDSVPTPQPGCIWTGRVTTCHPSTYGTGTATVNLEADGPLSILARSQVKPLASIGPLSGPDSGLLTKHLAGNACLDGGVNLLGPFKSNISVGADTPGVSSALDTARKAESIELGRLYESPEGFIGFNSRSQVAASTASSYWSDTPGAEFAPTSITVNAWRSERRNRVISGVSAQTPLVLTSTGIAYTGAAGVQVKTVAPLSDPLIYSAAKPNDLLLAVCWGTNTTKGESWLEVPGWTNLRSVTSGGDGKIVLFGKIMTQADIAIHPDVDLYANTSLAGGVSLCICFLVRNFYGNLQDGIKFNSIGYDANLKTSAQLGRALLPEIKVPWPGPTMHLRMLATANSSTTNAPYCETALTRHAPYKFWVNEQSVFAGSTRADDIALTYSWIFSAEGTFEPSDYRHKQTGYDLLEAMHIMIRGYTGAGPNDPYLQVISDDLDSQAETGGALTYELPGTSFHSKADALAFNQVVLNKYSYDNPSLTLTFAANKNSAYRAQALNRRIGDRIAVDYTGKSNMGIKGDYAIESISHSWDSGERGWLTQWGLAPI